MLVQSEKILPPPGDVPDFESLAQEAKSNRVGNEWVEIPASQLSLGLDDLEDDIVAERYFGWDNEKPVRKVDVPAFQAKARPITNQEYAQYLSHIRQHGVPASWALPAKERYVNYGPILLLPRYTGVARHLLGRLLNSHLSEINVYPGMEILTAGSQARAFNCHERCEWPGGQQQSHEWT